MRTIEAGDVPARFLSLLDDVAKGQCVTITRQVLVAPDASVAGISPYGSGNSRHGSHSQVLAERTAVGAQGNLIPDHPIPPGLARQIAR